MQKIKVCHLTSVHSDNDVRILLKECKSLVAAGFDVSLILVNGTDRVEDEVKIMSVKNNSKGRLKRATGVCYSVYKQALKTNAGIYHFHDPELLWVGCLLRRKGKKVVYDVHEDLPRQILSKPWIHKTIRKFISAIVELLENYFAKRMSGIVAATPFIQNRFLKLNQHTILVCNYPLLSEFNIVDHETEKKNEVCYVGGISVVRGIHEMLNAINKTSARLNLAGVFESDKLFSKSKAATGWEKVNYFGFVNRNRIQEIMAQSKAGLVILHPIINYLDALPIKMFEYMAAGLPVIASDFPLWKEIIEENQCGIVVNPFNINDIANAIQFILEHGDKSEAMGLRGKKAVMEKYNWETEAKKLIALYHSFAWK